MTTSSTSSTPRQPGRRCGRGDRAAQVVGTGRSAKPHLVAPSSDADEHRRHPHGDTGPTKPARGDATQLQHVVAVASAGRPGRPGRGHQRQHRRVRHVGSGRGDRHSEGRAERCTQGPAPVVLEGHDCLARRTFVVGDRPHRRQPVRPRPHHRGPCGADQVGSARGAQRTEVSPTPGTDPGHERGRERQHRRRPWSPRGQTGGRHPVRVVRPTAHRPPVPPAAQAADGARQVWTDASR